MLTVVYLIMVRMWNLYEVTGFDSNLSREFMHTSSHFDNARICSNLKSGCRRTSVERSVAASERASICVTCAAARKANERVQSARCVVLNSFIANCCACVKIVKFDKRTHTHTHRLTDAYPFII